jgi:hypothetical protein
MPGDAVHETQGRVEFENGLVLEFPPCALILFLTLADDDVEIQFFRLHSEGIVLRIGNVKFHCLLPFQITVEMKTIFV